MKTHRCRQSSLSPAAMPLRLLLAMQHRRCRIRVLMGLRPAEVQVFWGPRQARDRDPDEPARLACSLGFPRACSPRLGLGPTWFRLFWDRLGLNFGATFRLTLERLWDDKRLPLGTTLDQLSAGFGPAWDRLWADFGPNWDQLWGDFVTTSERLWINFGLTLDQLWLNFGPTLGRLWVHFGPGSDQLWGVIILP